MKLAQIAPPWIPVPPLTYGGTELMVGLLVRGLASRGHEVLLFCAGDSTLPVERCGPYAASFWPPEKFSENRHLAYAWERLRRRPPDLIHSHLENAAGFAAAAPLAPLVITLHTPLTEIKRDYLLSFPQAAVVAVSDFQYRQLTGHPRLSRIPHGIEVGDYPFRAAKEDFVLFLGRIYPDKGLHTAMALAREAGARLVIAGPVFEPDRDYFEDRIRPHLDQDRLIYLGPADFATKTDLLSRARALLLPLEVDEAFGLVMLEAMACGTPVLAYDRGAAGEVVVPGETGFLARDPEGLRRGLERLSQLQPGRCREHVAANFSRDRMVDAYVDLYRRLR